MKPGCINKSNPDFKAIVIALENAGVTTAEFEATRDYLEYGTFRSPEDVVNKVLKSKPEAVLFKGRITAAGIEDLQERGKNGKSVVIPMTTELDQRIDSYLKSSKFGKGNRTIDSIGKTKPFYIDDKIAIIRNKRGKQWLSSFTLLNGETGEIIADNAVLRYKKDKYVRTSIKNVSVKRSAVQSILVFNKKLNDDLKQKYGWDILQDLKNKNYERIDRVIDEIVEDIKDQLIEITENNKYFNKTYLNKYNLLASRNATANALGAVYFKELMNDASYGDALAKLKLIPDYFWNALNIQVTDDEYYDPAFALPFVGVTTNNIPMLWYQLGRQQRLPGRESASYGEGYSGQLVDFEKNPINKLSVDNDLFTWLTTFANKPEDIQRFMLKNENYIIKAMLDNMDPEIKAVLNIDQLLENVDYEYRTTWTKKVKGKEEVTGDRRLTVFLRLLKNELSKTQFKNIRDYEFETAIFGSDENYRKYKADVLNYNKQLSQEIKNYFSNIPNFSFLMDLFQANRQFAKSYTREYNTNRSLSLQKSLSILIDKSQVNYYNIPAYVLFHEIGHAFHLQTEVFGNKGFYNNILQLSQVKEVLGPSYYSSDVNFKELVADVFALSMLDSTGILDIESNPFPDLYEKLKNLKIKVGEKTLKQIQDVLVEKKVVRETMLKKTSLRWDADKTFLENIASLFNQIVDLIKQGYYMEQSKYFETVLEKVGEQESDVVIEQYKTVLELVEENIYTMLNDVIPDSIHLLNPNLFKTQDISEIQNIAGKTEYYFTPQEQSFDDTVEGDLEAMSLLINPERSTNPDVKETSTKTAEVVDNANANSDLLQIADMLMINLGVNYELITVERAKEMLGDKYNGEPASFYGDVVMFVGERLTTEMVFHEFAHPLVRSLRVSNPELFNKLYDSLEANSPELVAAVKAKYPDLVPGSNHFKEEVVVTALGKLASQKYQDVPVAKGFAKIIQDIVNAIKKIFRQFFGKVNVSTLDVDTSLDEIANMLVQGNRFELVRPSTEEDIAYFFRNTEEEVEALTQLIDKRTKASTAQQAANIIYEKTKRHVQELRYNKDYSEVADLFRDSFGESRYRIISRNLSKYSNLLDTKLDEIDNDLDQAKLRSDAVINSLVQIDTMAERLRIYMEEIADMDNKDHLAKMMRYNKILNSWGKIIDELKQMMREAVYMKNGKQVSVSTSNNPTYQLISSVGEKVEAIKKQANDIIMNSAAEVYEEILTPLQEAIEKKYEGLIALAKSTNQPAWLIKKYEDEYAKMTLKDSTGFIKDKIKKLMGGELKDAHWLNSYFEGYMYNQDPVIFGLAKYIKDNYIDAVTNAQKYYNEFATAMNPLLTKIGYNPNNIRELGSILSFLDEDGYVDERGIFRKRMVHTFLNANKNWRHDLKEWEVKLEEELVKAKSHNDYTKYRELKNDYDKWKRKYFYQPQSREIYDLNKLFQDTIGQKAKQLRDDALTKINSLSQKMDDPNDFVEIKILEDAWDEYNQLYSLTYKDGTDKTGDDLQIALRLIEYRNKSREYYKYVDRPGVFQAAFSSFLEALTYELKSGKITKEQFDEKKDTWLRANSVVKIKESFYVERNRIINGIIELTNKIKVESDVDKELAELYKRRANIVSGNRDDNRQLNLDTLSADALDELNKIDEDIDKLKDQRLTSNGLTKVQSRLYNDLKGISPLLRTQEETDQLAEFEQIIQDFKDSGKAAGGLTLDEKEALNTLFQELDDLQTTKPSNYYLKQFAEQLKLVQDDPSQPIQLRTELENIFKNIFGESIIDITKITDKNLLDQFERAISVNTYDDGKGNKTSFTKLPGNEKLRAWFSKTHKVVKKYDKASMSYKNQLERRYAYTFVEPVDNEYKESTLILNENGEEELIYRVPTLKFKKRVENDAYMSTERTVYKTIDNRGQWLPKNKEDMIAYRAAYPEEFNASDPNEHLKYINEKYYELKEDPAKKDYFTVLEKLTDFYLKYQEGLGYNAKLYLDVPRYRMEALESYQLKGGKEKIKSWWQQIKYVFQSTKDGYLDGQNFQDEVVMTNIDMFDEDDTRVPIEGKNYIDPELVSLNVINSVMRYMLSGEKHKVKIKMLPFAKGVQEALKDPATKAAKKNKDMTRFYGGLWKNLGRMVFLNKKGENARSYFINQLFEREFEGVLQKGFTADYQGLNKISDMIFKRASMGFFALNVPSALKNNLGQLYQATLESVGGKYYNTVDLAKGVHWANKTSTQITMNIYNRGVYSLEMQKVEIMDPSQGRFEKKMRDRATRTFLKDATDPGMKYLNSTRALLELQASLSVYGAMMYGQMVEINEGGSKKMISYMDAWELDEKNQIRLKAGIDKEWGVGGKYFKTFVNRVHDTQNKLAGAYADFEQPELQRYLLFRHISFLKRFFTRMLLSRFQFRGNFWDPQARYNVAATDTDLGWYIEGLQNIFYLIKTQGHFRHMMGKREKLITLRMLVETFTLYGMIALLPFLFGYDSDDPDRFKKLREKSGNMPFLFAPEDDRYEFNLRGWLENHALLMMMQVRAENETFNPLFGYKSALDVVSLESIGVEATIEKYLEGITNLWRLAVGDKRAFYQRDVGAYEWMKKGSPKMFKSFLSGVGFTGSTISPVESIKYISTMKGI